MQTGAAFGPGAAALVYAGLYAALPEAIAWRALFGCLASCRRFLVLWVRRNIDESVCVSRRSRQDASPGDPALVQLFLPRFAARICGPPIKVALPWPPGAQGGVFAVQFWMPTYLRTVRGLSASTTGTFVFVQMLGALIGFLLGAYLSDIIGRKLTLLCFLASRHRDHVARVHVRADGEYGACY